MKLQIITLLVSTFITIGLYGQRQENVDIAQFSGLIITHTESEILPVPYTNIYVKNTNRGTFSNFDGFYSLVVEQGDTLVFSAIGFKTEEFIIPDTLTVDRYTMNKVLDADTLTLQEAVVMPWPSRDFLKQEFLAMDVTTDLEDALAENLSEANLEKLRATMSYDGQEYATYYLREQSKTYNYNGQLPPNTYALFNPFAWVKFFQALKNGDFKQK